MSEATIVLGSDGSYVDASPAALRLLGLTLEQLRAMAPGSLSAAEISAEEREAMRQALKLSGAATAVGSATIQRPNGQKLRVRFLLDEQPDGGFVARLVPVAGAVDEAPIFYTVGDVLSAWRAAERRLEKLERGTPDWAAAEAEIEQFRAEYQRLAERRSRAPH